MSGNPEQISALASRSPGEDDENPYEDVDIDGLPEWWQRAIAEFDSYGLRPYRPPRFSNGTLKHETVESLESEFGIEIQFFCMNYRNDGEWEVSGDGETLGTIGHHRDPGGYSVFEMSSEEFDRWVRSYCRSD